MDFFIQYLIANAMTRARVGLTRHTNNFDNRRFATAKEITNASRRNNRFKIKFVLLPGKKICGNVVERMRLGRRVIECKMQCNFQTVLNVKLSIIKY